MFQTKTSNDVLRFLSDLEMFETFRKIRNFQIFSVGMFSKIPLMIYYDFWEMCEIFCQVLDIFFFPKKGKRITTFSGYLKYIGFLNVLGRLGEILENKLRYFEKFRFSDFPGNSQKNPIMIYSGFFRDFHFFNLFETFRISQFFSFGIVKKSP